MRSPSWNRPVIFFHPLFYLLRNIWGTSLQLFWKNYQTEFICKFALRIESSAFFYSWKVKELIFTSFIQSWKENVFADIHDDFQSIIITTSNLDLKEPWELVEVYLNRI